jgi:hypothetical protein
VGVHVFGHAETVHVRGPPASTAGPSQLPRLQTVPSAVQSEQAAPPAPQAVSLRPVLQVSLVSQQPVHVIAQFAVPVGALQTLTGI